MAPCHRQRAWRKAQPPSSLIATTLVAHLASCQGRQPNDQENGRSTKRMGGILYPPPPAPPLLFGSAAEVRDGVQKQQLALQISAAQNPREMLLYVVQSALQLALAEKYSHRTRERQRGGKKRRGQNLTRTPPLETPRISLR